MDGYQGMIMLPTHMKYYLGKQLHKLQLWTAVIDMYAYGTCITIGEMTDVQPSYVCVQGFKPKCATLDMKDMGLENA
jgi:hypothetical protein